MFAKFLGLDHSKNKRQVKVKVKCQSTEGLTIIKLDKTCYVRNYS